MQTATALPSRSPAGIDGPTILWSSSLDAGLTVLVPSWGGSFTAEQVLEQALALPVDQVPAPGRRGRSEARFVGGFDLEGAEAIGGAAELDEPDRGADPGEGLFYRRSAPLAHLPTVLDGLTSLVEQSIVRRVASSDVDDPRYRMLEIVREFGRDRLAESGEEAALRTAHAAFIGSFLG
jgi:hypothetical protein